MLTNTKWCFKLNEVHKKPLKTINSLNLYCYAGKPFTSLKLSVTSVTIIQNIGKKKKPLYKINCSSKKSLT